MRLPLTIGVILLLFTQCAENKTTRFKERQLVDTWQLDDPDGRQVNYPLLVFGVDGIALFHSRGDTVYSFNYRVTGDTLVLGDNTGGIHHNRIKTLTNDELVFYNLMEHNSRQVYKKRRNDLQKPS